MEVSIYDVSAGQFIRSLSALRAVLTKAAGFADQKKVPMEVLFAARLAPDQFALARQVQTACDTAKLCVARLTSVEAPKNEDTEQTLEHFLARIDSTVAYLRSVTPAQFGAYADKAIRFPWYPGSHLTGSDYLVQFALPNFYFHVATAYSILRANGVDLGKSDYLGEVNWRQG